VSAEAVVLAEPTTWGVRLILNRPDKLNAISVELREALDAAIADAVADERVRVIVIAGAGRAFCAGYDLSEAAPDSAWGWREVLARDVEATMAIWRCPKPIIAQVHGYALAGGLELAMACDLIVASESAKFGQPETGVGVIPGAGGTQRLTRAVGKALAMDVILSGRFLSADEALAAGLVARVVPEGEWLDEAKRVAQEIASKAPIATRLAKEGVDRAYEGPLQLGLEYERRLLYLAFASEDTKEGLTAFMEKRKPEWKAR